MTREEAIQFIGQSVKNDIDMAKVADAIKALEQGPCEDAVSRKAVIEILQSLLDASMIEFFTDKINQLPPVTPTQRWISVSERLPKETGFYLVSTTDCITIMEFMGGWISQNIGSCNWYVKAWMPLPKPYKAESEE